MPLGRLNAERGWWQKPDPKGQSAVTKWKVLGRSFVSPPPFGVETSEARSQGSGVGVSSRGVGGYPPPPPSPARGEGAVGAGGATQPTWPAPDPVTARTHHPPDQRPE